MARLIVTEFVSLDGVMEAPGGEPDFKHSGWVIEYGQTPEHAKFKLDETLGAGSHLLGRKTYEGFAAAWPKRSGEFADKFNADPKHVVTTTLSDDDLEWDNSKVVQGGVPDGIEELKGEDGDPILVAGSRTLVQSLLEHDLVDELRLMTFPVILGSGARLFPESPDKLPMKLVDSQSFNNGVVVNTYEPERG